MQTFTTYRKAHALGVALILLSCGADLPQEDTSIVSQEYSDTILEYLNERADGGPYFYTLCTYVDGNDYHGKVLFIEMGGVSYLVDVDPNIGNLTQIVAFRRSESSISLGDHWGGNGTARSIREFITQNSSVLDSQWDYSDQPLNYEMLRSHRARICSPPPT